jgi:hypothetical protein
VELIDQVLWEQELTEHLRQSGNDPEQFSRPGPTELPAGPDIAEPAPQPAPQPSPVATAAPAPSPFPSVALVLLWVAVIMVVSGVGWAVGWFLF